MIRAAAVGGALIALASAGAAAADGERVLAIGGSVTEILYALGREDRVIDGRYDQERLSARGHDARAEMSAICANCQPKACCRSRPDTTSWRRTAPARPTPLRLPSKRSVPPSFSCRGRPRRARTASRTKCVSSAQAMGVDKAESDRLADALAADFATLHMEIAATLTRSASAPSSWVRLTDGRILAAGADTSAEAMLKLAGAENAIGGFSGYKPVNSEAGPCRRAEEAIVVMTVATATIFPGAGASMSPTSSPTRRCPKLGWQGEAGWCPYERSVPARLRPARRACSPRASLAAGSLSGPQPAAARLASLDRHTGGGAMSLAGAGTLAVAIRPAGDRSRLAGLVLVGLP